MTRPAYVARRQLGAWANQLPLFSLTAGIGFVLYAAWLTHSGA
ncbi:hypothetical protein [Streptomyces sulphureus]|nr:hypothetical protein [Streptomyces sulphureus]